MRAVQSPLDLCRQHLPLPGGISGDYAQFCVFPLSVSESIAKDRPIEMVTQKPQRMALRIRDALSDGVPRGIARSGIILMVSYFLVSLLQTGLIQVVTSTYLPLGAVTTPGMTETPVGPDPGAQLPELVSAQAAAIAGFTGGVLTTPVQIVSVRTLVSKYRSRIPEELIFHRLGWATVNTLLGSWLLFFFELLIFLLSFGGGFWVLFTVFGGSTLGALVSTWPGRGLLAVIGLVLLFPVAFFAVSMTFLRQEIAVRDKNLFRAAIQSWRLTSGNRIRLIMLSLLLLIPHSVLAGLVFQLIPAYAQYVVILETAVVTVITQGIMAVAYIQLTDDSVEMLLEFDTDAEAEHR